jgi:hypothetical protein
LTFNNMIHGLPFAERLLRSQQCSGALIFP